MSADSLRWLLADALTGEIVRELPVIAGTSLEISTAGDDSLGCSILLGAQENAGENWRELLLGRDRVLAAVTADNFVIAAGLLSSEFAYNPTTTRLDLKAVSLESLFDKRMILGVSADPLTDPESTVAIVGKSWPGVAAFVVSQAIQRAPSASPAIITPQEYLDATGTSEEYYKASEFHTVRRALNDVRDRGFELRFVPSITSGGGIIWALQVGAPLLPSSFAFAATLSSLPDGTSIKESLRDVVSTVWGVRTVPEVSTPFITKTEDLPAGRLLREFVITASQGETTGEAQAARLSNHFAAHRLPEQTFDVNVWDEGGAILRGGLGGACVLSVENDPWLGTQSITARVIGISASGSTESIRLTLAPESSTYAGRAGSTSPVRSFGMLLNTLSTDINIMKRTS